MTTEHEPLLPPHGGYRKLKSFQLAQLIYDLTVHFCDHFVDRRSRTHDQMVQAARSGVQNIAEGSQASGTSKKMELKLTNVARASLEELRLDYEDFLRQHELESWPANHPALQRFKSRRCATLTAIREWIADERTRIQNPPTTDELGANAALSLLNLCCYLLDRQIAALAKAFETDGGFTERLYRTRKANRGY
ncbi:MAG: four helix bundle suffix domain-containing protein [Armatimonadota bacterium]